MQLPYQDSCKDNSSPALNLIYYNGSISSSYLEKDTNLKAG